MKLFKAALLLLPWSVSCNDAFKQRLVRIDAALDPFVQEGKIPGYVALVLRDGKPIYERAVGWADREAKKPMRMDTLFRVASHTKALTSVAALMLIEEGKLSPDMRLDSFLPAFKYARVAVPILKAEPIPNRPGKHPIWLSPIYRPITIHHLLTHTSGLSYGFHPDVADHYGAFGFGFAMGQAWYLGARGDTICEAAEKMAALPLSGQPGTRWVYGYSTDILGCVIEKVSGMKLDEFFRKRIFEKLEMKDTAFHVKPEDADRFAVQYERINGTTKRARFQGVYTNGPPKTLSGGAGLVSTVHDFARFMEMIRNGGVFNGERLLKPESVALMTSNLVGDIFEKSYSPGGFGYGFEIAGEKSPDYPQPPGAYGWYGIMGTFYRVLPKERLAIFLYTQVWPRDGELRAKFMSEILAALNQAE